MRTRRAAEGHALQTREETAESEEPEDADGQSSDTQSGLSTPPRAGSSTVRARVPASRAIDDAEPSRATSGASNVLLSLDGPHLAAKAYGPKRIVVSQQAEFLVVIRNLGSSEAKDVQVMVSLPSWVDIAGTKPSRGRVQPVVKSSSGQQLQWRIDRIGANADQRLTLQLIPRESQPVDLAVRWTHVQAGSRVQVDVEEPLLQMVISGASEAIYGQMKLYNLTLTNPGTGEAENVVVHLLPLGGARQPAVAHNAGTLRRGESKTIQVELSAGKAGTLLIKAHATADGGLRADATKEVLVRRASLHVGVEGPKAQYAGNMATYRLRVHNPGNASAEEVTVTAILPPGAEVIAGTEDRRWTRQRGQIRWKVGQLAAGQAQTLDLTCRLTVPGINRMRIAAEDNTDLAATSDAKTDVIARGDLKLVVSDPQGPVPVGEEAVYELRIRNRGTKSAEVIETVVFFSEGVEAVAVQGGDHEIGSGQVLFKAIPTLAAGGEIVLKVTAKAEREGNHVFRAEVLCRTLGTKLAAQETTHFYGSDLGPASAQTKPLTAERPQRRPLGPTPIERE